jgi:hypothetical protein
MTVTAVKPQATATPAPAKAATAPAVKPAPAATPSRPKPVALVPMRRDAAKLMRGLAASVQKSHPDMNVHDHLRDAAKTLEAGNEEGAQRHLRAAFFSLTPQSLHRHGLFTDDAHTGARQAMHAVHRHIMLVKDIADADAKNQAAIRRDSGDGAAAPQRQPDPNAGYGPGALAQKPGTAPGLNAPAKADGGGPDLNVAEPPLKMSKQFSYDWDDILRVIDLVGPHGFEHDWVFVGIPSTGQKVTFGTGKHATGTVSHADATHVHVRMGDGSVVRVPHNGKPGPGKLTPVSHAGSPEAAAARKAADNVRFERGLTRGQKEEGEQRLYKAASHLDAGNHGEAASELDAAMHATSLRGGAVIKGSTAAQARGLRDKVRAGQPAARALTADRLNMTGISGGKRAQRAAQQAVLKQAPLADLKAIDAENTRRAVALGKPGQVSATHQLVKDEIASRKTGGKPVSTAYPQDELAAIDLVGPAGFQHGWTAAGPTAADHDKAAKLHTAAAAKAKDPAVRAMHLRRAKVHTQVASKLRSLSPAKPAASASLAYDWDDLLRVIELSAKTAALEATPAPRGKPGGPGLYHVAGQEHTAYFQNVVKALIEKRGMPPAKAYAVAYGALRKWSKGGGKVSPEVSAAATGSLAGEKSKVHSHAGSWDDILRVLDFGLVPGEPRVPAGSATAGQFSAGAGAQPAAGQQPAKAPPQTAAQKKAAAAAAAKARADAAHKAHVAHVAHVNGVSTKKAGLLVSAQDDRQQADALIKQRDALAKALASASGKTSTGQAGSTTSANSTTSTTAPATAASATAAAPATASTTKSTTAAKAPAAPAKAGSAAAMKAQIAQLDTQITALQAAAATATAQAAKLK